jgi:acyl dehydratase
MTIDYDRLLALRIPDVEHRYTRRDTILYALGVGLGADPLDPDQLRFVYEPDLQALPTMAVVLAYPGFWVRDLDCGIDWVRVVHGEQGLHLHKPLPPEGHVVGETRVIEVIDKGPGKGALVYTARQVFDKATGDLLAGLTQTIFCRSDGGFGGPPRQAAPAHALPDRLPDRVCILPTLPQAALLYRLSGDYNPLHADPAIAREAGYDRPILHGLATYGVAGHTLLKSVCAYDPARIASIDARFSAPAFPGEAIRIELWLDGAEVSFRAIAVERETVVLNNGKAVIIPFPPDVSVDRPNDGAE